MDSYVTLPALGSRSASSGDRDGRGGLHRFRVNPLLRLLQLAALALRPDGEDLRQDRERGLLLGIRADVEPARAGDPLERLLGTPASRSRSRRRSWFRREPSAPM
jgi:hypothetical protein